MTDAVLEIVLQESDLYERLVRLIGEEPKDQATWNYLLEDIVT